MTPIPTELRELMEQICVELEHDNDRYMLGRELRKALATPPADDADMGGQAGEEVVTIYDPESRSYEEHLVGSITIVQHLDTKGSRKALGAMNAKLRCKVGHLERRIAEQCEELETLHKQLDRFRDGSHGIPALAEHERLRQELAQHRQQAGKLVEALRKIHFRADCFVEDDMDMRVPSIEAIVRIAGEALAAWEVKP